jgi:DNA-binding response OmpR family regulator
MRPKALLVEDDAGVRAVLCRAFTNGGWDIHASATPTAAISATAGQQFDVIVLDVMLPEMTGFQLASQLAELQAHARMIFISGYPVARMADAKWTEVLEKPFRTTELVARADGLLRRSALSRTTRGAPSSPACACR